MIYFSEEVKNPGRDIPRSLFGGVLTITAIYLLVNLALLYVLPISQIAGKEFAAGEAANVIFGALRRHDLSLPDDRVDAERHQRAASDGDARCVRDES